MTPAAAVQDPVQAPPAHPDAPTASAATRDRPRVPPTVLLAALWIYLFIRNGFAEPDRDPFYVARFTAPLFQMLGPGILLCMALVLALEWRRAFYRAFRVTYVLIAAMLALFVFSAIANAMPALNAVQFLFGYLQYAILVPFTVLCLKDRPVDFDRLYPWIVYPILFQFFVNLGWALRISPLQNVRRSIPNNVDWAYGTLTNTTEAAGIAAILLFFTFHLLVFKPPHAAAWPRRRLYFLIAAGFMLLLWADSKLTYLTLSAAMGLMCFLTLRASIFRKVLYTVAGFSFLACMFLASIYYNYRVNPSYSSTVSYGDVVNLTLMGGSRALGNNPKIQVYEDITAKMPQDLDFPVFGGGPGNATSRFAIKNGTPLAGKYLLPRIEWEFQHGNSMLTLPNTGFNAMLGDLGWLGVILYYSLLLVQLGAVYRRFRRGGFAGIQSTWAFVYLVFTAYFIIHSFIDDKLYLGTEVAFVWVMGVLLRQGEEPAASRGRPGTAGMNRDARA